MIFFQVQFFSFVKRKEFILSNIKVVAVTRKWIDF